MTNDIIKNKLIPFLKNSLGGNQFTYYGPKNSYPTFCRWNLNGLTDHDSTKISLLQAYITQHIYGIVWLTETFLNSSIRSDDNRITIDVYDLIKSNHPSNSEKGGVCLYYNEHMPLIL